MGRIRTKFVKGIVHKLIRENVDMFTDKFKENKNLVVEKVQIPTKKLRNLISGYLTKRVKTSDD